MKTFLLRLDAQGIFGIWKSLQLILLSYTVFNSINKYCEIRKVLTMSRSVIYLM